jgi:hypothetical protein
MGEANRRGTYEERKAIAEARDARSYGGVPVYKRKQASRGNLLLAAGLALAAGMDVPMGRRAK